MDTFINRRSVGNNGWGGNSDYMLYSFFVLLLKIKLIFVVVRLFLMHIKTKRITIMKLSIGNT